MACSAPTPSTPMTTGKWERVESDIGIGVDEVDADCYSETWMLPDSATFIVRWDDDVIISGTPSHASIKET
jgi:hypothetical protein